ncbi:hypothetical protein KY290_029392 [Solanum tuberosum]|uniref:Glycoside hydrolase family 3 C-terminal domain-containing protein n=1 Tax=Solanum tuberosum TaxID=4113 RepID=A0ABQ7UNT5_SOLTU|nr:hypothetical protein KY290_029392 [Solanum tuberosum]
MASYSSWNGRKMHADHDLVTGFLKDWQGIDRLTSPPHANYTYSVETSILAGVDMVMVPYYFTEFINDLTYLVKNNFIPTDRIDDAVERILKNRNLAREAVRKSLVLLKNGKTASNPLLPLPKKMSRILLERTTILGAIKSAVDPGTEVIYVENPDSKYATSSGFDYAIVVVGEHTCAESAGDSPTLTMADPGPDVINNVCQSMKCVVIVISGRPLVLEPYLLSIDALVAAWN